jgi:ribonuclease HI
MRQIKIYTDGSCPENPGRGGYATLLIYENETIQLLGGEDDSTNNRMELMGAIAGLEALKEPHEVEICSDSAYLVNCFKNRWFEMWYTRGWKTSDGKPVANKDLWLRLFGSMKGHKVKFVKVKGHADNELNNECDRLARIAAENRNGTG